MNVFIFTLGLTEAWVDKRTGRVFPTAPGTIAGDFDPGIYEFKNFSYDEIRADFVEFLDLVRARNPDLKIILTVSPVPLTATATDNHVLVATTYSKSVLRAVAGSLADAYPDVDYFPSYEMIASPLSLGFFYEANMRAVNPGGVAAVMVFFFEQHVTGDILAEVEAARSEPGQQPEARLQNRTAPETVAGTHAQSRTPETGQNAVEMAGESALAEGAERADPQAERQIAPDAAVARRRKAPETGRSND